MKKKNTPIPLIVETHPEGYEGYPFITLLQYHRDTQLTVIDNTDGKQIQAYVLDLCGPEKIDEEKFIEIVVEWWDNNHENYPISLEFSKLRVASDFSRIHRTFNIEYITRVIGPLPCFDMTTASTIKRRKRKPVPQGMHVHFHRLHDDSTISWA